MPDRQTAPHLTTRQSDSRNRLLVGYDWRPASQQALIVGAHLAELLDAHLTVMHVVDLEDYPIDPDRSDWEEAAEKEVALQQDYASGLLEDRPIRWTYQVARGHPAQQLAKTASDGHSIHRWKHYVKQNHVERGAARDIESFAAVAGHDNLVTLFAQGAFEKIGHAAFVFDHQDLHLVRC